MGRRAEAYSDFKLDAQGYSRFLVVSHALNPADAGRVVTRLLEMENYRITALIPLDVTRAVSKTLSQADARLVRILDEIADSDSAEKQHDLLNDLLAIARQVESHRNQLSSRFSASQAYYELVKFSYEKLNEEKLGGLQRLQTFVERRLGPAIRTFSALRARLEDISQRVDRIAQVSTRTEINIAHAVAKQRNARGYEPQRENAIENAENGGRHFHRRADLLRHRRAGLSAGDFPAWRRQIHGDRFARFAGRRADLVLAKKILHRINASTHLDEE